jgi:hypothetical protein
MRNTALVTGLAVGALGIGGAATASAAPVPITIDVTSGSVKAGAFAQTATTGTGRFDGTIDSETFAASFPSGNTLPSVTIPNVTLATYSGPLVITAAPGAFTGQARAEGTSVTLDLRGPVTYTFTGGTNSCTATSPTVSLTGGAIDLATGAYTAAGSNAAPLIASLNPFCVALALQAGPPRTIDTAIAGKLTIPGLIPLPTVAVVPPPKAPTTTTPAPTTPAPATPAPAAKPGRLSLTVSRPKTVSRGRSTVTKVVLRNTGAGTARGVTVRLTAAKGVTPRSVTKTYATIGAGKTRTFSVRLRTTTKTAKRTTVKVTAKGAAGLSASKSASLRLR